METFMGKQYHIILHVNRNKALQWDDSGVVRQWHGMFSGRTTTVGCPTTVSSNGLLGCPTD
jgi:hypothetical protein